MQGSTSPDNPIINKGLIQKLKEQRADPIFEAGIKEGKLQMKMAVLGYLETEYMNDTIERDAPQGGYLLAMAKSLSEFMKKI